MCNHLHWFDTVDSMFQQTASVWFKRLCSLYSNLFRAWK